MKGLIMYKNHARLVSKGPVVTIYGQQRASALNIKPLSASKTYGSDTAFKHFRCKSIIRQTIHASLVKLRSEHEVISTWLLKYIC